MSSFTLLGESLAVDLVNTLKPVRDQLDAAGAVEEFWRFQGERSSRALAPLPREDTVRLRALATALLRTARAGAAPDTELLAQANTLFERAPDHRRVAWRDGRLEATVVSSADGTPDGTRAQVLASVFDAIAQDDAGRLRECASETCTQLFLATNAKRRWCTAAGCGNRARVARHAARTSAPR